jgi:hypothetical protein
MTQRGDPKPSGAGLLDCVVRKLDGVGQRFEPRLWDAGIFRYEDLARRIPEEFAAALAPIAGISPARIASQGHELADFPSPEASDPRQHYAAFHVEFLLQSDNSVRRTKVQQHQSDARDAWPGWDEDRLLSFLRDQIPLPVVATPADDRGVQPVAQTDEPAQTQTTDQEPVTVKPALADQVSAPAPGWLPSWSLRIEELAPIRDGQPSYTLSPDEPICVRLTMRINPTRTPVHGTFDFSATVAARRFGSHDHWPLGTAHGAIRVSDPVTVEVTRPRLPADLYRLVVIVHIYPALHSREEPPIYQKRASGDLMRVIDVPLDSALAIG